MPATTFLSIDTIRRDFPDVQFKSHSDFFWSAEDGCVYYDETLLSEKYGMFHLLHELGHAICNHRRYASGIELLRIETEAWKKAQEIARNYALTISSELIEHCLDTYRDWLHLRSTCPECQCLSPEVKTAQYSCFNCGQKWSVPTDQRQRCYRKKLASSN